MTSKKIRKSSIPENPYGQTFISEDLLRIIKTGKKEGMVPLDDPTEKDFKKKLEKIAEDFQLSAAWKEKSK